MQALEEMRICVDQAGRDDVREDFSGEPCGGCIMLRNQAGTVDEDQ